MHAVTRLLAAAADLKAPDAVRERLVDEAREFFGVTRAVLLSVAGREGRIQALAMSPAGSQPRGSIAVAQFSVLQSLLESDGGAFVVDGDEAERLDRALGA